MVVLFCIVLTSCLLILDKVDKPKQNGSADGEDAVQGSKQGECVFVEHVTFVDSNEYHVSYYYISLLIRSIYC